MKHFKMIFNQCKAIIIIVLPVLLCSYYYPPEEVELDYEPIIMQRSELELSVSFQPSRNLVNPGKIYMKDNYIFINEKYKGIHVIDNTNPSSPENIGFIRIPGCLDIAILQNYLYADNAVDLITVDLSSIPSITLTDRIENIFPDLLPPGNDQLPGIFTKENRPENTIIIEWVKKTTGK